MPNRVTLGNLQHLYEVILGREHDKRNFAQNVFAMEIVKETCGSEKDISHRSTHLVRFDKTDL